MVEPSEFESPRTLTKTSLPTRGAYVRFVHEASVRRHPGPPQGWTPSPAFNAPPRSSAQSIAAPSRCDLREPDAQRDIFLGNPFRNSSYSAAYTLDAQSPRLRR
ncbi:MAG: hypothetical protein B6D36_01215 [Planctomycetes bacterium UTPLA1]|nr:MAG: hypothetical protein B6D36_01215 [Planctomycetes bacterium UTPLA1]